MGLDLLIKLLKIELIEIYVVNRGKIHWNGLFYEIVKNNKNVHHFISDRNDDKNFINTLKEIKENILKNQDGKNGNSILFEYIIDFSCFEQHEAKIVLEEFSKLFKNYILISTDSTYNASEIALERNEDFFLSQKEITKIELITEKQAFISGSLETKGILKKRDRYGYDKLKCEQFMKKYFDLSKESYFIILRLPDVIGSFDESFRMWYYVEWLKHTDVKPIEFEKVDFCRPLSFVLKDDVTELIYRLVKTENLDSNNSLIKKTFLNQEYNIAHEENVTLKEFIDTIAEILKINYKYTIITEESSKSYYPSVTFGPISVEKAKKYLDWKPSNLKFGIEQSVKFFENEGRKYQKEFEKMKKDLPSKVRNIV